MSCHRLALLHPFDPRREPADHVEARLTAILGSRPVDFEVLIVGVDRRGDLVPGEVVDVEIAGRPHAFLPVTGEGGGFTAGLLRHLPTVRAAARADVASISVHAIAWAPFARLVGRPIVLVVHDDPRADAVAGRAPFPVALREHVALRVADRILAYDPEFVRRCRETHPALAAKTELVPLPVAETDQVVSLFSDDLHLARMWERHRRLFDAVPKGRGSHAAA